MQRLAMIGCVVALVGSWLVSNHYPPWVTSHSELLAACAAALLALAGLYCGADRIGVPIATMFFFGLALVPLVQASTGFLPFVGDGWIAALYLFCSGWVALWSAHLAGRNAERLVSYLATGLLVGGLASCWIVAVQVAGTDIGPLALHLAVVPTGHAPFGNLGQPNQLADLLSLSLVGLFVQFERRRVSLQMAIAALVVFVVALAATQSRTVLLFFATSLIWYALLGSRLRFRTTIVSIAAAGVAWGAAFLCWPSIAAAAGTPVLATTADRMQAGPRTVIWAQLWDAVWLHPWLGWGWNQVGVAQIAVAADHPASRMVEHSHNLILDLALWNGVPIALVVVAVGGMWLVRSIPRIRTIEAAAAVLLVGLLLAHSMVEFPLEYLYFLVPFSIGLGVLAVEVYGDAKIAITPRSGKIALVAFVLITGYGALDYWDVEQSYREMRFTVARIGGPMSNQTPPPLKTQFTQLDAFYRFALTPVGPDIDKRKLEWMKDVAHRYGYASALYRYGLAQAINGDLTGARLTFLQLRQLWGEHSYGEAKAEIDRFSGSKYPILKELRLP